MKKVLVIMLAVLMLTFSAVCAQETDTVQEINWEDIATAAEETIQAGSFYKVSDLGIMMWVPDALHETELTDEDIDNGYISYMTTEDGDAVVAVILADAGVESLEAWMDTLSGYDDITKLENGLINGLKAVTYFEPEKDTMSVDFATVDGSILEFTFWPMSNEGFSQIASIMSASIQPYEE